MNTIEIERDRHHFASPIKRRLRGGIRHPA